MHGLYGEALKYFKDNGEDEFAQIYANDAVMKYIIFDRFYGGYCHGGYYMWSYVAGPIDYKIYQYLSQYSEYDFLKSAEFIDPDSGESIDFVHMIAVINALCFKSPLFDEDFNAYCGWAGDLITLTGEMQGRLDEGHSDISQIISELMGGNSTFSTSDLLGDMDAVVISRYMSNTPIYEAIETYYSDSYRNRYALFMNIQFEGDSSILVNSATSYLSPNILTNKFKSAFGVSYGDNMPSIVATAFSEYLESRFK